DAAAVDERLAIARDELRGLEADEKILERLERQDRWIAGSLTPTERELMTRLSDRVRADSGIVADVGLIEVGPLAGPVTAAGARVEGVRLEARLPIATRAYLADEELVSRFRSGLPRPPTSGQLAAAADLRLSVASVAVLPSPEGGPALRITGDRLPAAAELRDRLRVMPATAPALLRARVADALACLERVEQLRAGPLTPARQQELVEQTERARALLGTDIGALSLGRVTGQLDPATGALVFTVHDVEARDIIGDGFAVRHVRGDVSASLSGLLDLQSDPRQPGAVVDEARGRLTGGFGLDLVAAGVTTEAGQVGEVTVAGLRGEVRAIAGGYRFSGVWATRIELGEVALGAPGNGVTAVNVQVEGLRLDGEWRTGAGLIRKLGINTLRADRLRYEGSDEDGTLNVELVSGALTGIEASELTFARDAKGMQLMSGKGSIGGFADLRYRLALGALGGGSPKSVSGTLSGGAIPKIRVSTASAGGRTYSLRLADLQAFGTEIRTPDGTVVIQRMRTSGTVTKTPAGTTAALRLTDIGIGPVRWRSGSARLSGPGPVTLRSVDVEGTYEPTQLRINKFDARGIEATGLRYVDGDLDVRLGRFPAVRPGALSIQRAFLQDFVLPLRPGGGSTPTAGKLELTGSAAEFRGRLSRGLSAEGEVSARSIEVGFFRDDTLVVEARGLGGDVSVEADDLRAHATLNDADTGVLRISPDAIRIGGPGVPGLRIGMLDVDNLAVHSAGGEHPFDLRTLGGGGSVYLLGIDAAVTIERWRPREPHPKDKPFRRVVLDRFAIDRIDAEGLELELPADNVRITVPLLPGGGSAPVTQLRHVVLQGAGGAGFDLTSMTGVARLDQIVVPRLEADVRNRFRGAVELQTGPSSIGFLARGGTVVDIANPRARITDSPELTIEELGATSVHVAGGIVSVTGAHADRLSYEQPGIAVQAERIAAAGTITASSARVEVPELRINDGHVHVNFAAMPAGSGGGSGTTGGLDQADLARLMDSLQGSLGLTVFVTVRIPLYEPQDLRIPVRLQFTNGAINYQQLQRDLQGAIKAKDADETDDPTHTVNVAASRPEFWMERNDLVVGLHLADVGDQWGNSAPVLYELARWNLATDEVRPAAVQNRLRLARAINPAPSGSSGGGGPVDLDSLEIRDIAADLSVRSGGPIPLNFTSNAASGRVVFAPDALVHLRMAGFVPGTTRAVARGPLPGGPGLRAISLDQVNLTEVAVTLSTGDRVTTGRIELRGLRDGTLSFAGHQPMVFDARIVQAVARSIVWKRR
ncbi:MAG: hypothetical protein ABW022_01810, partial [Actinoplanes sp.]